MVDTDSSLGAVADIYHWKQVSAKVAEYVEAGAPAAILIKKATARFPEGAGHALLAPLRNELWVVKDSEDFDYSKWEKLACLGTLRDVHVSGRFPQDPEGWVYLRTGAAPVFPWMAKEALKISDIAGVPYKIWKAPGDLIGGHNTATGALTGAALGGLAGYGLGKGVSWAIRKPLKWLLPEYFGDEEEEDEDGKKKKAPADWWAPGLAAAGAIAGGGLPLFYAAARKRQHGGDYWGKLDQGSVANPAKTPKFTSAGSVDPVVTDTVEHFFDKMANIGGVGSMFNPTINAPRFVGQLNDSMFEVHSPLDAVGNPVISHAIQPANPFGTRNPYGSRYAPMYAPPAATGAMAGMVSGAAAAKRSNWVSPMDVARMAWGAGSGALSGIIAGKVAGGLAGLNSRGQKQLQRMGLWGGLLSAASRAIF